MSEQEPPTPQAELTAALEALFESDERWKEKLAPGQTLIQRTWPDGTTDTVIVLSPLTAYVVREDSDGLLTGPPPGTVWEIIEAARQMSAPDDPDTPTDPDSDLRRGEWR